MTASPEFSFRTRTQAIENFKTQTFDLLIIGGGITGAATARDAASRGLKVALVEKNDFASGTSSKSSKLIHGGLRYLENMEMGLVFEALSERALLLKTAPHLVKPLLFYMPAYDTDKNSKFVLNMGLWLYDMLSLGRSPKFHKKLSKKKLVEIFPYIRTEGLKGGFSYYDASMWDDALTVDTLRSASQLGAQIANYVEAKAPLWTGSRISGFKVIDKESEQEIDIKAKQVVVCAGPWTDDIGIKLNPQWKPWLTPSKGVHLIFDLKKLPVPGVLVMTQPEDGRISFAIPRPDFGNGVTIVGTTDGPAPKDPGSVDIDSQDVAYLMDLLHKYFPKLNLTTDDIISAYVGIRPLMDGKGSEGQHESAEALQKVSREHHIGDGPGGTIIVAGGKYTTHRNMAEEIVDTLIKKRTLEAKQNLIDPLPKLKKTTTKESVNPLALPDAVEQAIKEAAKQGKTLPEKLIERYGAETLEIVNFGDTQQPSPEGFPMLPAQLKHAIRTQMIVHLEDFYLRRLPLFAARADHGLPWAHELSQIMANELGADSGFASKEEQRLKDAVEQKIAWTKKLSTAA